MVGVLFFAMVVAGCMGDDESTRDTTTTPAGDPVDEASTRPVYDFPHETPSAIDAYWTNERIESLPEHELPIRPGQPAPDVETAPDGPPVRINPKPPGDTVVTIPKSLPSPRRILENYTFRRYRWPGPNNQAPAKMWGRIIDDSGYCSGTIVASANKSLVWTAGHCLWDNDTHSWYDKNPAFIPGYRKGRHPFGKWTSRRIGVHPKWKKAPRGKPAWGYDVGYLLVERLNRKYLTDRVDGFQGMNFNDTRSWQYLSGGYPAKGKFKGRFLQVCDAPFGAVDKSSQPATTAIGCDMTEGSSGGGWVIGMGQGQAGVGWVYGVNSYGYPGEKAMYSPYFGREICNFYGKVSGMELTC